MLDSDNESHKGRDAEAGQAERESQAVEVRELYLDLEDTVIEPVFNGWFKTEIINFYKIKAVIEEFKPTAIHLFSYAIWDEKQRELFKQGTLPLIESTFGIKLGIIPTVDTDIRLACCSEMCLPPSMVDFNEINEFWGKQGGFRLFMLHRIKTQLPSNIKIHALLLDDIVIDEKLEWPKLNAIIEQRNIDQL